jgi:hypothetical protein
MKAPKRGREIEREREREREKEGNFVFVTLCTRVIFPEEIK